MVQTKWTFFLVSAHCALCTRNLPRNRVVFFDRFFSIFCAKLWWYLKKSGYNWWFFPFFRQKLIIFFSFFFSGWTKSITSFKRCFRYYLWISDCLAIEISSNIKQYISWKEFNNYFSLACGNNGQFWSCR